MSGYPEITLDELPRHTEWPARLLAVNPEPVRHKIAPEVLREFDRDKWGALLRSAQSDPSLDVVAIERLEVDPQSIAPFFAAGKFALAPHSHVLELHLDLYADVLGAFAAEASALVELGAGYGAKLLKLAGRERFARLPLFAGELTANGRELIWLLAARSGRAVRVSGCDFRAGTVDAAGVPEGAIVYTSYAVHYVPELDQGFVRALQALKPRVVVHFEPCLEHFGSDSLYDLLCRSYILRNDYNRNLAGVLAQAERDGTIRVVSVRRKLLGGNPLLPISVIAWTPCP